MTATTTSNGSRQFIDVSRLPASAMDYRSPVWWGNALLLCIESSMFMIVIASYFYFRRNFDAWPPAKIDQMPVLYHPYPHLGIATLNLILLLLSVIPMYIGARACLRMDEPIVKLCATLGAVKALIAIGL